MNQHEAHHFPDNNSQKIDVRIEKHPFMFFRFINLIHEDYFFIQYVIHDLKRGYYIHTVHRGHVG